jgi:tRNA pseudouridine55 synthase
VITLEQLQDGIVLPIDKPRQWTSFQAVNKIKAVVRNTYGLKKFKIGHAGTLDPLATGLLLVCLGKATKRIPQLQDGDKVYTCTLVFGATTPCFDLEQAVDQYYPYEHITRQLIEDTLTRFTGTVMQVPPMFSAVKIDGQRAYEIARTNNDGPRDPQPPASDLIKPKPVRIYSIELTDFRPGSTSPASQASPTGAASLPNPTRNLYKEPQGEVPSHLPQADLRIHCGKGTYIRSLARDLGQALGSGAFLSALRREQIGDYSVDQALQLDQVASFFA